MDAALFSKMLTDPSIIDLKKMSYKYPHVDMKEFVTLLKGGFYHALPLRDFDGNPLVYLENQTQVSLAAAKVLLTPQSSQYTFGLKAMEDEIISSLTIEQVDTSRDSVRRILTGSAPKDESENRVYGMKKGLDYIADPSHIINEENLHQLYQLAIGNYLPQEDQLLPGKFYRHDSVYIVGSKLEHAGLDWQKLPDYMSEFVSFIQEDSKINDLLKAAVIHFYLAYLHPYFDGNGRMARLLHLWYLVQRGYSSALFVPLLGHIEKTRSQYYKAYSLTEENARIGGVLDVTAFLVYFIENVYHKLEKAPNMTTAELQEVLASGKVTEKEQSLWQFVLSAYGEQEFSTKQLERAFGKAAYATIRGFVLKFEQLGLLQATKYGNRTKYCVSLVKK